LRFGRRDPEYRGENFSLRIETGFREIVFLVIKRNGVERKLEGERIGKTWQGIGLVLPGDIDAADVTQVVRDIETALSALRVGYVISRTAEVVPVPEADQQAAIAELNQMGFEVERSANPKQIGPRKWQQISTTWKPGAPRPGTAKAAKEAAQRMRGLIETLSGSRRRMEVLSTSKEFADYMPR